MLVCQLSKAGSSIFNLQGSIERTERKPNCDFFLHFLNLRKTKDFVCEKKMLLFFLECRFVDKILHFISQTTDRYSYWLPY